ncbi:MAG TPA: YjbQ family protein, partial [bacterium]|nr:YjbQ family protein [bacterium]
GRANARSHLMSLLLSASETVPVADGKLLLGDWQSIFFVELDGPRERRGVCVKIMGEEENL